MSTSFGFTLVATLANPIDFSNSFLHFNNKGEISAIFTLDAAAKVEFDTKPFNLANVPLPGAGFRVPGVMTIGPQFNLDARVKAGISISGHVEAKVEIASWEVRQTMPEQSSEFAPQTLDEPSRNLDVSGLKQPEFDASVEALGYLEAHLLPTLSFGIKVEDRWNVGACSVDLVADGWVRLRAKSDLVGGDCGFAYAVDAGAGLVAKAIVPDAFKTWQPKELPIAAIERTLIPSDGTEWKCLTNTESVVSRGLNDSVIKRDYLESSVGSISSPALLQKRASTYGPIFKLPDFNSLCPKKKGTGNRPCSEIFGLDDEGAVEARDVSDEDYEMDLETRSNDTLHWLESRQNRKDPLQVCGGAGQRTLGLQTINFPNYPAGTVLYDNGDWSDCNNYVFGIRANEQSVLKEDGVNFIKYINEHVLEAQMLQIFMNKEFGAGGASAPCVEMGIDGWRNGRIVINGVSWDPWTFVASAYPGNHANGAEIVRIFEPPNTIKEFVCASNELEKKTPY